ncbi:MAG: recombinase family protein [Methylocella sp.]
MSRFATGESESSGCLIEQARDNTIASQVAALRERVAADGFRLMPDHGYVDEGYSGTILLPSGAGKVAGFCGRWDRHARIYIHAPDRLARRYAHQVLLIKEFHRAGADVIFLNHSIGGTAEDDLLLQVQGVIAEYERAKILERGRRGRRHAARCGSVSALTGAPFGYRYVRRDLGGGVARFEVVEEEEACIVRLTFAWVGLERTSIREVCRRLERMGCRTRQGATRWYASTICGMLKNPTYIGRAVFGRVWQAQRDVMNDTVATEDQEQPAVRHERKARCDDDRDPGRRTCMGLIPSSEKSKHHTTSFPNESCRRVLGHEKSAWIEIIESRMRRFQGEPAGGE